VEAAKWWRLAAEQGNAEAQFLLAVSYEDGVGVPKDLGAVCPLVSQGRLSKAKSQAAKPCTAYSVEVDAVAMEPVRALRWEVETLERYLVANPEVRIVLQRHLARDLAGKFVSYAGHRGDA
jgi:hypothetical protein